MELAVTTDQPPGRSGEGGSRRRPRHAGVEAFGQEDHEVGLDELFELGSAPVRLVGEPGVVEPFEEPLELGFAGGAVLDVHEARQAGGQVELDPRGARRAPADLATAARRARRDTPHLQRG